MSLGHVCDWRQAGAVSWDPSVSYTALKSMFGKAEDLWD